MKIGRVKPDVGNLTAQHGLGVKHSRMSPELKAAIKELVEEGYQQTSIARYLGIPDRWVGTRVYHLRAQRQMELPNYQPDPKYDLAQEMWRDGYTVTKIAKQYGYSVRKMNGVIERYRASFRLFPNRRTRPKAKLDHTHKPSGEDVEKIVAFLTGKQYVSTKEIEKGTGLPATSVNSWLTRNPRVFEAKRVGNRKFWRIRFDYIPL